ncbi:MAG TPA: TrkA family potassium uptake protein [Candidatus Dormibacteraeota bacterium]|jgi:trk system potassium uptake protein TrkA|nr:TrkA family potassium uptake protein [Candidatus Dormibacteraeota bacterium]
MKVLIIGCGRVGSSVAKEMCEAGHEIIMIDWSQDALNKAASRGILPDSFKGTVVVGDGTDEDLLRRAGIESADALVAVTDGDNRNIMAAQIAREIFKVPKVVCRIRDPIREEVYKELGLMTICLTKIGAAMIEDMLQGE